jgi:hypothetical protein
MGSGAAPSASGGSASVPASGGLTPPATATASGATVCPHCGTENLPDALFCEDCGYDFTTGAMPRPLTPPGGQPQQVSSLDLDVGPGSGGSPAPALFAASASGAAAVPAPTPTPAPDAVSSSGAPPAPDAAPDAGPPPDEPARSTEAPAPVAPPIALEWVAEVWVDPDWYALQEADEACPSPGLPRVVPLTERSVLVGRTSASRNIHPQIDIASDVGVSRRHAQLTTDGQRWWVEDLQSANGTWVAQANEVPPSDPVAPGRKRELAEDDRIYLGAWSRLVVRRATPEEQAGTA